MSMISFSNMPEDRTLEEQVICSTEAYSLFPCESGDSHGLVARGRGADGNGPEIEISVRPCAPVPKEWAFSSGLARKLVIGEDKHPLVCGECGAIGDESPWYSPFFIADCDTPICLECVRQLMA